MARSVRCRSGTSRPPVTSRPERVLQPRQDRRRRQQLDPRRSQLDGQRQAVETLHDRRDRLRVALVDDEARHGGRRACREQLRGLADRDRSGGPRRSRIRQPTAEAPGTSCSPDTCSGARLVTRIRSSRHAPSSSATNSAAGSTCSKLSSTSKTSRVPHVSAQVLEQRPTARVLQPDALRDRDRHQIRIRDRRERHEVHALGQVVRDDARECDGQPRLAAAAGPGQGQQPVARQQAPRLGEFLRPAHEARPRSRQATRPVPGHRRKAPREPGRSRPKALNW